MITGLTSSANVDTRPKPNLPAVGGTDLFFAESDGVAPLHEYALTKVWAEQLGKALTWSCSVCDAKTKRYEYDLAQTTWLKNQDI